MPIYAYRCESCGFEKDVLRKMSDAPLTQCPECQSETFRKQVTAAGFQLKGSGWYVTDFRGGSNGADAKGKKDAGESKSATGDSSAGAAGSASSTESTNSTNSTGSTGSAGSAGSTSSTTAAGSADA